MLKNFSNGKYQGQALAIVLIVLVVAVIIGLAILSRTLKDSRRVVNEQESAESIEIADTALDALKDITLEEFAEYAEGPGISVCNPGGAIQNYDFFTHGCEIKSDQMGTFLSHFGAGYDVAGVFNTINSDLQNQCISELSGYRLKFEPADAQDEFEIAKDSMFAYVPNGNAPTDPACQVNISASSVGSNNGRLINANVYLQRDATSGLVSNYKEYEYNDIRGYCFQGGCATNGWSDGGSGISVNARVQSGGQDYYINEIRLRALHTTMRVSATTTPSGCVPLGTYMKISAIVNCGDNSRGKEIVVSNDQWAPQIFDYVLFNGDGELRTFDN